jgi:hypothetical protein
MLYPMTTNTRSRENTGFGNRNDSGMRGGNSSTNPAKPFLSVCIDHEIRMYFILKRTPIRN